MIDNFSLLFGIIGAVFVAVRAALLDRLEQRAGLLARRAANQ